MEPYTFGFCALILRVPLNYIDSMLREVYYEGHMTCILHTARISNVDSVMFVG